ncbi:MAG: cysteine hydrolase family protein [Candidatus Hodarchaeota archaeon]
MSNTALLIIDIQTGNFSEDPPIHEGNRLLSKVQNLVNKARAAEVPVIFIQNNGNEGDPDAYNTPGWHIHASIAPIEGEIIVQKHTPDAFHETNLHVELGARKIKKLIIAGLQTEYCIDTTCRRAFSLGYEVVLVRDTHSTWNSPNFTAQQIIDHHNYTLGGFFVSLENENEVEFKSL